MPTFLGETDWPVVESPKRNRFNGRHVVDATEPFSFDLTSKGIKKGVVKAPEECVLAQCAFERKEVEYAFFEKYIAKLAFVDDKDNIYRYELGPEERQIVRSFDKHPEAIKEVLQTLVAKHGSVTLLPPRPSRQLGYRSGKSGKARGRGGGRPNSTIIRNEDPNYGKRRSAL